ncbi:Phage EaA protein [Salmonella enterica subsp. enterica]|nr:Phage EaA protein [Salmonella enterica subsp. enterica]
MTTITREQQKQILIDTANHVISRDNTSPYSENLRELARIALASLEAEPIGAFHIADQQVGGTSDYIKDGEWPIDNGVIEVYAAQPASERERIRHEHAEWSYADPVVFTDERNLHHIAMGRETSLIWGKQNQEVGDIPLYRHTQPAPVVHQIMRELVSLLDEDQFARIENIALSAGVMPPQPAPVVPEEIPKGLAGQIVSLLAHNIGDKFLAQKIWSACRAAMLKGKGE